MLFVSNTTRLTKANLANARDAKLGVLASSEKPLYGEMELEFNLSWVLVGPNDTIPDWVGTVTIDGSEYPMAFFNIGLGNPFVEPLEGRVIFFGEIWRIYNWMIFDPVSQILLGDVLLWGYDEGVVTSANSKYQMNGNVEEALGTFAEWEGRNVHMSGIIEWYVSGPAAGAPHFAPGTFRIN